MKRAISICVLGSFVASCANESATDAVLEGSYRIVSELDVQSIYEYEEITGDLTIQAPGLADFQLPALRRIGGDLIISGNAALSNLIGLSTLRDVGGNVSINDNDSLRDLAGLDSLGSLRGDVEISHNEALLSVQALANVSSVGGSLGITHNAALTTVRQLAGLTSLGGLLQLSHNPALSSLGLDSLHTVGGESMLIYDNPSLPRCQALALVAQVEFAGLVQTSGNDDTATCN